MDTEHLILALAEDLRPVRPLAPVSRRLAVWLAIGLAAVVAVVWTMGPRVDLAAKAAEATFVVQQLASLATAVAAAFAAFAAGVPGAPKWKRWLPAAPLGVWMASLGHQCWQEWVRFGAGGMEFRPDFICIPGIALVGLAPALAMVAMLRRGAPFHPRLTVMLGTLAAAALANFGLRLFHPSDAALMVLVWQFGTVVLFTALAGLQGRRLLRNFQ